MVKSINLPAEMRSAHCDWVSLHNPDCLSSLASASKHNAVQARDLSHYGMRAKAQCKARETQINNCLRRRMITMELNPHRHWLKVSSGVVARKQRTAKKKQLNQ